MFIELQSCNQLSQQKSSIGIYLLIDIFAAILAAGVTVSVIVILMILIVAGIIIGCIHKYVRLL